MENLEKALQSIGLSEKESRVYIASLKFPNQATSILAKKTALNRGTTFVILNELLKKGLVTKSISSDVQRFTAVPPKEILNFLDKKEFEVQKQKGKINELLPQFENLVGQHSAKPIFQFYEGRNGLQNLISEMLRGDHTYIKSILSPELIIHNIGSDYWEEHELRRIKKKYQTKVLLSYNNHNNQSFKTSRNFLRNTKYMPEPLFFPMTTFLFGNTAILLSQKDNFGLSIQSSEYVDMQNTFFDTLWAISKSTISENDFRMPII